MYTLHYIKGRNTEAKTHCIVRIWHVPYCSEPPGHATVAFLPLLTSPLFFLILSSLPSAFSPCPVTEPSVWTDGDIGCVGDRPVGVISEGEKNRSASLYLTPFLLHQPLMTGGLTRDTVAGNVIHLFFKRWLSLF